MNEAAKALWVYAGVQFDVGDMVKVVRKPSPLALCGMGKWQDWENTWIEEMDEAIGETFKIQFINTSGVHFEGEMAYAFPLSSLEKAGIVQVPDGDFTVVDTEGTAYGVYPCLTFADEFHIEWMMALTQQMAFSLISRKVLLETIKSGEWVVVDSKKDEEREVKFALLATKEAELAVVRKQGAVLISEINNLEKEISE